MPKPEFIGVAKKKIIAVPCRVKSWSYSSGVTRWLFGTASWVRMTTASNPASMKKKAAVTRYRRPMRLWLTVVRKPTSPGFSSHSSSSGSPTARSATRRAGRT